MSKQTKEPIDYLKKAQEYLDEKREEIQGRAQEREAMLESIKSMFGGFGVNSIQIGSEALDFEQKNMNLALSQEEQYWTEKLNKGTSLFLLSIHADNVGYSGKEAVQFCDQKLSDLIDEQLVKQLAPTCKIYAPKDNYPWEDVISLSSFKIFVTEKSEFDSLWNNLDHWVKMDWHDNITKTQKHFHKAEHIFQITLYHSFASDLSWRNAQYKKAEKELESIYELGDWNSSAQTELKKTLSSLLYIEYHPVFGHEISKTIEKLIPLLAQSMEGKEVLQEARNKVDKLRGNLYKGLKYWNVNWRERTQQPPITETIKVKKLKK